MSEPFPVPSSSAVVAGVPPPVHAVLQALMRLVLGPAGRQRVRVSQTLLSLGVFLLFALILQMAVLLGLAAADRAFTLTAFSLW